MMTIPLPTVSQIVDLVKKGATIEAQEQIMRLREAALECQEESLYLKQQLHDANTKIKDLETQLSLKAKVRFEAPAYYLEGDSVPLCQACYENDSKLIHLSVDTDGNGRIDGHCKVCDQHFTIKPGVEVPPIVFSSPFVDIQ